MQENKVLIQEISTLREQAKDLRKQIVDGASTPKSKAKPSRPGSTVARMLSKSQSFASEE